MYPKGQWLGNSLRFPKPEDLGSTPAIDGAPFYCLLYRIDENRQEEAGNDPF